MARMLQALKNLEARTVRPQSGVAAKPKASRPVQPPTALLDPVTPKNAGVGLTVTSIAQPAARPQAPDTAANLESLNTVVSGLASLETSTHDSFLSGYSYEQPITVFPETVTPIRPPAAKPAAPKPVVSPTVTDIERTIGRMLANPIRSKPLRELADRLRRDLEQTAAKTVAFVGVNDQSTTHEAILYAATLLAQQGRGRVLMVDGDFSRRSLSESLEYAREAGLTDLLKGSVEPQKNCRATATGNLSLLPVGVAQSTNDLLTSAKLGQVYGELATSFDCLLVDCGRTCDSGASALARTADATYLVVQLGTIEALEAQAALAVLRATGARVLGCIAT